MLRLSPAQNAILVDLQPQLEKMGFSLSPLGSGDWAVNAVPTGMKGVEANDLLMSVVDDFLQDGEQLKEQQLQRIVMAVASKAAINRGRVLTHNEINTLLNDLFALPENRYTPTGKLIYKELSLEQLEKMLN